MLPSVQSLPVKYQIIDKIISPTTKNELAQTITAIFVLLKDQNKFESDHKTKQLVGAFFTYLSKKCLSATDLNLWSIWILKYASVVHHHLLILHASRVRTDQVMIVQPEEHLNRRIYLLIKAIAEYNISNDHCSATRTEIILVLDQLTDLSEKITPNFNDTAYISVTNVIDVVYRQVLNWLRIGDSVRDLHEYSLLASLIEIRHRLKQYHLLHP